MRDKQLIPEPIAVAPLATAQFDLLGSIARGMVLGATSCTFMMPFDTWRTRAQQAQDMSPYKQFLKDKFTFKQTNVQLQWTCFVSGYGAALSRAIAKEAGYRQGFREYCMGTFERKYPGSVFLPSGYTALGLAFLDTALLTPVDRIKHLTILNPNMWQSAYPFLSYRYINNNYNLIGGLRGAYTGAASCFIRNLANQLSLMLSTSAIELAFPKGKDETGLNYYKHVFQVGVLAGAMNWLVTNPFDLMRVIIQSDPSPKGQAPSIVDVLRQHTLKEMYTHRGAAPNLGYYIVYAIWIKIANDARKARENKPKRKTESSPVNHGFFAKHHPTDEQTVRACLFRCLR